MQDQSLSSISFIQFNEDQHLNQLFQAGEQRENFAFTQMNVEEDGNKEQAYSISINPEEMEKGYQSQDGTSKKNKNKKIKKKKPMFIERQEETKKRRIKLYIESLENRIAELQTQNDKLKKLNELNIGYIKKLNDSEQVVNGFFIDRQKIFQRMQKLMQTEKSNPSTLEMQLQIQYETLQRRQGAFGKERIRAISYYFKQLLHLLLPNTQKYISEAAYNSTDIFSPDYRNNQAEKVSILKRIQPTDELIQRLLEKQSDLTQLKQKFNEKVISMYKNKCDIIQIIREMEQICESCGEKVTPIGRAKFLCYAERNKQQEEAYPESLREMYEELQKCNKFTYPSESETRRNAREARSSNASLQQMIREHCLTLS